MSERVPLFPLGTVLFPGAVLPLRVFEPRYRALVADLLEQPEPRSFAVVAIREGHEVGADRVRALHDVGCLAEITELHAQPGGQFALLTVGTRRFALAELDHSRLYLQADVEMLDEAVGDADDVDALAAATRAAFFDYAANLAGRDVTGELTLPAEATQLSYAIGATIPLDLGTRQSLLAAPDTTQRLIAERDLLTRELGLLKRLGAAPLRDAARVPRNLN